MRWAVKTPVLSCNGHLYTFGEEVPVSSLTDSTILSYLEKGYLALDEDEELEEADEQEEDLEVAVEEALDAPPVSDGPIEDVAEETEEPAPLMPPKKKRGKK